MVTPSQPCPPSQPQSYQVTFTVSGLPAGTTVPITYSWRLVSSGGGGKGQITASEGSNSTEFRVKAVQDSVIVDWSTPDGQSGSSNWVRTCEIIG
jgi:hypothetical protein